MKTRISKTYLLAAAMLFAVATGNGNAKADGVDLAHVLNGGPSCDHVIRLMMRHGVNNTHATQTASTEHHSFGPMLIPAAELGDLELVQISQKQGTDPACGPQFCVTVRNNSTRDVCGFRITLVGLLGRIHSFAPTAVVKVDKVCAGAAVEVPITLPIEALSMGNRNGQVIGFQKLVVAIDSFDQFVESNEANNIKVLARTAIPAATVQAIVPAAETPVVPTAEATSPAAIAPTATAPAIAPAAAPAQSGTNELKSAIDQLNAQQQTVLPASGNTL